MSSSVSKPAKKQIKHAGLDAWFNKGSYKELCGHSIFTIDEGDQNKPVIVLIHGFPTSSWDWEPVWSSLMQNHRLITLDMLGFGFSDKPNQRDYTIHKQADLFEALVQQLGINEYHVFAHDYGVSVAQELLARQIDGNGLGKWLSCGLLNGGLFPETHKAILIQKLLLSPAGKLINKLTGFKAFGKSFSSVFGDNTKPSEQELHAFWEAINFNDGRHVFHNLITYILDRVQALQDSPFPISLINGSVDPVSGAHLVKRYKELNCRLDHCVELSTIGHYPHVEAPEQVSEAYLSFLKALK